MAKEANPLLKGFDTGLEVVVVGLAIKYGIKHILVATGASPENANLQVNVVGMGATCANLMTLSGVAPPASYIVGIVCAATYYAYKTQ